ncbi:transcriptional regulator NanR [Halomonas sp. McH1-25]|uniref:transcriptional regulator NanR n=1 Tax=unclassified Halomonas TaxID=2609666 RepID=UPI001EF483E5|nr:MULTISPECIES: transcriptional regulator NanR [unclassified Halomonas]MCG7599360.1 transcriptional regulator NanR [Halomonas sp. McH1-25]MCP1343814.1 transcriptional regulator NanR [Halomonas sp. FL8]MCP1361141.1 transcriptional regulator NanR [Halomonas sp. BBD45]MCP1363912.1 transcriptional regulator NanR [Halomonas sp. BBD48]
MSDTLKIARRKLSDDVFDRLYAMLLNGDYRPGENLPSERQLMEMFGVGRPAVREAMQSLERAGLVSIHHGQRPTVTMPTASGVLSQIELTAMHMLSSSPQSLEQLKEARAFFELGMVARAAEKATKADTERLEGLLEAQRAHLNGDAGAFIKADMSFHVAIAEITGNAIFLAVSNAMLDWLANFHTSALHWKGNEQVTLEEHARILEAIRRHDGDAATDEMRAHLDRAGRLYVLT